MTHDEASKNHPGGVSDTESFEKDGRMYRTSDDPNDGFNALQLYISKLNPKCAAFFQFPKRNWSPDDAIWFENRPHGVNKLSVMMKQISEEAQLSMVYTNHCVRATAITLWSDGGLANRHIMAISGHRNEQSLKSYNSRLSSKQLRQCSDILSSSLLSPAAAPATMSSSNSQLVSTNSQPAPPAFPQVINSSNQLVAVSEVEFPQHVFVLFDRHCKSLY
jgi:hypothetical protein